MEQTEIANIIIQTITTLFNNLFSSIDNSVYSSLDNLVFTNSSLINNSIILKLFNNSGKNSLIYLSDTLLLGLFLFYLIRYYYFNIIDVTVEKPTQFIFKLFIFTLIVNFSYFIIEKILDINYLFSSSIQEIGKNIVKEDISFSQLILFINQKTISSSQELNILSFDGLIKSYISIGLVSLLISYSLRFILLQVLLLLTPFSILSLINYSTSWIFKSWGKCLFYLLIIQIFIPILIIIIFCIDTDNKILFVSGLYSLIKINDYVREIFGGMGLNLSSNISNIISKFKS